MTGNILLYVEDEDAAVYLVKTALEQADIHAQLFRVSDGEQALAFLNRRGEYRDSPRPDLILLDLNLPRKNGLEVLTEIRRSEHLRSLRVIVFTSSFQAKDRRQSMDLGADEYITKPSTYAGLVDTIRAACGELGGPDQTTGLAPG